VNGAPSTAELLDALPDGAALVSADGRIQKVNRAFGAIFEGMVEGRSFLELTRNSEVSELVARAVAGMQGQLEIELGSSRRTLWLHAAPLQDRALVIVRDISQSKYIEKSRRDFVSNASHELRTPVAAISLAADTLLNGACEKADSARQFSEIIARNATRLSRLAQELLDLSRIESGDWRPALAQVSLADVGHSVRELLAAAARSKEIVVTIDVTEGLCALGDGRAIEQVLVNLVDNAIKYGNPRGQVSVVARAEDAEVAVSVTDSGPGIERHHLARLFERFYRVDPGRDRQSGGTGLGLAIVKHLIQAQGGRVGVDSSSAGSRFWFRLPLFKAG
jgi:two-component system phosphate regulon sensor histidine kinase PhoR